MNKNGFTFLEVLVAMLLGLMVSSTLFMIPAHMVDSYSGYIGEVKTNRSVHQLTLALNKDLVEHGRIEDLLDGQGYIIGGLTYSFKNSGVYRETLENDQILQLTTFPMNYSVNDKTLELTPTQEAIDENDTLKDIQLIFSLKGHRYQRGGINHE